MKDRETPTQPEAFSRPGEALHLVAQLAVSLQHHEQQSHPDADEYQRLIHQLQLALQNAQGLPGLPTLLAQFPAAAAVYENLQYEFAGLCLQPLDRALAAESQARDFLNELRRRGALH